MTDYKPDLVEELRSSINGWEGEGSIGRGVPTKLEAKAANEIETQAAEIEALYKLVSDFADAAESNLDVLEKEGRTGLFDDIWDKHGDMLNMAREALKEKP